MVDRVYKTSIPAQRKALERLKAEFSGLNWKTDWTKLRIEPLLQHAKQLEQLLRPQGSTRLTKGVGMFHSDLVYLRDNIRGLEQILRSERESLRRRVKAQGRESSGARLPGRERFGPVQGRVP